MIRGPIKKKPGANAPGFFMGVAPSFPPGSGQPPVTQASCPSTGSVHVLVWRHLFLEARSRPGRRTLQRFFDALRPASRRVNTTGSNANAFPRSCADRPAASQPTSKNALRWKGEGVGFVVSMRQVGDCPCAECKWDGCVNGRDSYWVVIPATVGI